MSVLDHVPVFCVVCGADVPLERKIKRSITCTAEHAKQRKAQLRARKEAKICKYCDQPATPEQVADFKAWRRDRNAKRRAEQKAAEVNHEDRPHEVLSLD